MSKKLNVKAFDAPLKVDLPKPPARTPVPEPEADRFVEESAPQAEPKPAPRAVAPRTAPGRAPKRATTKTPATAAPASRLRREESGERVVAYVPTDLATDLRVTCARSRRSMSDAVTEALTMWLSAHSAKLLKQ
jgi:hypothetical protein